MSKKNRLYAVAIPLLVLFFVFHGWMVWSFCTYSVHEGGELLAGYTGMAVGSLVAWGLESAAMLFALRYLFLASCKLKGRSILWGTLAGLYAFGLLLVLVPLFSAVRVGDLAVGNVVSLPFCSTLHCMTVFPASLLIAGLLLLPAKQESQEKKHRISTGRFCGTVVLPAVVLYVLLLTGAIMLELSRGGSVLWLKNASVGRVIGERFFSAGSLFRYAVFGCGIVFALRYFRMAFLRETYKDQLYRLLLIFSVLGGIFGLPSLLLSFYTGEYGFFMAAGAELLTDACVWASYLMLFAMGVALVILWGRMLSDRYAYLRRPSAKG